MKNTMDAVIFCNDSSTVPEPLARRGPLCFLPVGNTPLLDLVLQSLSTAGVTRAFLVLDPATVLSPAAEKQWREAEQASGLEIEAVPYAGGILDTATRVRSHLGEDFLLLPKLSLAGVEISRIMGIHRRERNALTYYAARGNNGELHPSHAMCLNQAVMGLSPVMGVHSAPELVERIRQTAVRVNVCAEPLDALPVQGLGDLFSANMLALRGKLPQVRLEGKKIADGVRIGTDCRIHPSARIKGPVLLGNGCIVARNASIGPHVVLGPGSIVDRGALVRDAVTQEDAYVGPGADMEKCWIGGEFLIRMANHEVRSVTDPHGLGTAPSAESAEESSACCAPARAHRLAALAGLLISLPALVPCCIAHVLKPSKRRIRTRLFVQHPLQATAPATSNTENEEELAAVDQPFDDESVPFHEDAVYEATRKADEDISASTASASSHNPSSTPELGFYHVLAGPPGSGFMPRSLPALWDVVLGRIALVGVEPLTPEEAAMCVEPWEQVRFAAPPGLVQPRHAFSSRPIPQSQKRAMEHFYARTRTVRSDIRLLFRAVLRRILG